MAKSWIKVGQVLKGKTGSNYLKVNVSEGKNQLGEVTLKSGQILTILNPRKRKGITDEEIARIPDYVVADVLIAPDKE